MTYFRDITKTEAFAAYGAVLNNPLNGYSAVANDHSVVVECWGHLIKRIGDGVWRYQVDDFSEWTNIQGKNQLEGHLRYAIDEDRPVRLVIAMPKAGDKPKVAKLDGTKIPKTISIRKDFVGKVVALDADHFIIDFFRIK
jgi:hypothetical protein